MSRPWQFSEDSARSPFDRPPVQSSLQPPSFKTNVNRNKSKKWTEAKNYSYDGDDWGGYDPYDEYGSYENEDDDPDGPGPELPSASSLKHRKNSFDNGDEQRNFSAGTAPIQRSQSPSEGNNLSQGEKNPYEIRRDFTQPAHIPPPLSLRGAPSQAPPPMPALENKVEGGQKKEHLSVDPSVNGGHGQSVPANEAPLEPGQRTLEHQPSLGFTSVVHQAFDRKDDSSVPPTPISRDNSQSETSGISPIMSRISNAATTASVPPISEEPNEPASSEAGAPSIPASFTPGYRRSLEPPSQESITARVPELEYTKRLSHPMAAESIHDDSDPIKASQPPSTELANDTSPDPDKIALGVSQSRNKFLPTSSPTVTNPLPLPKPLSRASSPSPGRQSPASSRVRELAGQYDVMHAVSRSNSSLSMRSKSSGQSWERSDSESSLKRQGTTDSGKSEGSELNLPQYDNAVTEPSSLRPELSTASSFRPHLPGEWVSFTTSPADHEDVINTSEATPRKAKIDAHEDEQILNSPNTPRPVGRTTEPIDLTPTTSKQKLPGKDLSSKASSPVDAVKAAGDALGSALMASMGLGGGHEAKDFAEPEKTIEAPSAAPEQPWRPLAGDVHMRPLKTDYAAPSGVSSVASTMPPTSETTASIEQSSGYFTKITDTQTAETSPQETESDRLRKEIERSLTPQLPLTPEAVQQAERDQDALDAPSNLRELQRAEDVPQSLALPTLSVPSVSVAPASPASGAASPNLLDNRLSWEKRMGLSEPLFATEDTEPRMPYERPLSTPGLRIVNTNISTDSDSPAPSPVLRQVSDAALESEVVHPVLEGSPQLGSALISPPTSTNINPNDDGQARDVSALTTPSLAPQEMAEETVHDLPMAQEEQDVHKAAIETPETATSATPASLPAGSEGARIPPFREILALKSAPERISRYNDTRTQFASMDTGLSNWISTTISANPEHAHLTTSDAKLGLTPSNTSGAIRHKGPSIMKIARNLGPSSHGASASASTDKDVSSSGGPERQGSVGRSAMHTRGKDLMKSAGAFGGKAFGGKSTFGTKGLFAKAKGKLREGSEKVD